VLTACRPDIRTAKRTVAPTAEPLTLADAKSHLRITDEAVNVEGLLASARARAEGRLERALITQTWTIRMDGFWAGDLELPWPPLQSVAITYRTNEAGTMATLALATYVVDTESEPGRVRLAVGQSWPSDLYTAPGCVLLTYVAGYGADASAVPDSIKQAVRLLLGHYEGNAQGVVTGTIATLLPEGVEALLAQEAVPWD
jgi:uncharacterized phiE125 gp8 family phage protein